MHWDELKNWTREIFAHKLAIDPELISGQSNLNNDLGPDHLDSVEIIMEIEKQLGVNIVDNQFLGWDDNTSSGPPFKHKTFDDFVWNLGLNLNMQGASITIKSDFVSISLDENGKYQINISGSNSDLAILENNILHPAGLHLPIYNKWESILKELEELLNTPNLKEYDLQVFLQNHPELITQGRYDTIIPEATISTSDNNYWSADFILRPIDPFGFSKIIELKKPSLKTYLRNINRHDKFSSQLYHAVSQLKDYSNAFHEYETRERFNKKYGFEVYKPDLHLIIGSKWDVTDSKLILEFQRRHNLRIETWDSFLDNLKRRNL